jgi:uncharacterized protein
MRINSSNVRRRMRRKDKEITSRTEINSILDKVPILHLALLDGDCPYIIPVNFGYRDDAIYVHCAKEGKKIDLIRENNKVGFQAEAGVEIVHKSIPDKCGTHFRSVAGNGRIFIVESREEKRLALTLLMQHYDPDAGDSIEFGSCLDEVCILKIEIDAITGKQSLPRHTD